jgi:hypothetical protein
VIDVLRAGIVAFDKQLVALGADSDMEERFEVFEVLVVGAEERLDSGFGNGDAFNCLYLLIFQLFRSSLYHSVGPDPLLPSWLHDANVQLPKLFLGHRGRRVHQQILGILGHRKRNHLA